MIIQWFSPRLREKVNTIWATIGLKRIFMYLYTLTDHMNLSQMNTSQRSVCLVKSSRQGSTLNAIWCDGNDAIRSDTMTTIDYDWSLIVLIVYFFPFQIFLQSTRLQKPSLRYFEIWYNIYDYSTIKTSISINRAVNRDNGIAVLARLIGLMNNVWLNF